MKRWISLFVALVVASIALPAYAGKANVKKLSKKWPAIDVTWADAFDVWMSDDELDVFEKLTSTEERQKFLEQAGYWKMWEAIDEEMLPNILEGKVVKGMTRNEVLMVWNKPEKIRKDFTKEAYVSELHYKFEYDRKGRKKRLEGDEYNKDIEVMIVLEMDGLVAAIVSTEDLAATRDAAIAEKKAAEEARKDAKPTFEEDGDFEFGPDGPEAGVEAGTEDAATDKPKD
jgi:hypothetical protein